MGKTLLTILAVAALGLAQQKAERKPDNLVSVPNVRETTVTPRVIQGSEAEADLNNDGAPERIEYLLVKRHGISYKDASSEQKRDFLLTITDGKTSKSYEFKFKDVWDVKCGIYEDDTPTTPPDLRRYLQLTFNGGRKEGIFYNSATKSYERAVSKKNQESREAAGR